MLTRVVVFALLAALAQSADRDARLVQTAQGPVRGYRTADGELFAFYSIPYATAPTGTDRFKAPLPAPQFITPFEAIDTGISCPQTIKRNRASHKNFREDCLVADVFIPDINKTNLPVVVYVHGGVYQIGHGKMAMPTNLVRSKKIIAVTFNYRLGAHGFLCLGTAGAPGNAGMKDQVALLRWLNKNIASFGGNPDDVTVAGFSSGSMAVDLLQLSKTTKGLFNKVIPESGAGLVLRSIQLDPLENAKKFARSLNFTDVDDVHALEQFYQTLPFQDLNSDIPMSMDDGSIYFAPCVERDTGVERFLEDAPANILKEGKHEKLPMLFGVTSMEGLLFMVIEYNERLERMNQTFSRFLPADLEFESEEQKEQVANEIKQFYFGDKHISNETAASFVDYFTDALFVSPVMRSVKLRVEAGNQNIYLYEYSFTDENVKSSYAPNTELRGAEHCAQSEAVLDGMVLHNRPDENNIPERYQKMKAVMREIWINFITTGVPVPAGSALPSWPVTGAFGAPHMSLNLPPQLRDGPLLRERMRLWDSVYEQYYRMPITPPTPPPPQISGQILNTSFFNFHTIQCFYFILSIIYINIYVL